MQGLPCQTLPTPSLAPCAHGSSVEVLREPWARRCGCRRHSRPRRRTGTSAVLPSQSQPQAMAARPITATGHAQPSQSQSQSMPSPANLGPSVPASLIFLSSPLRPCLRRSGSRWRPLPAVPSFPGENFQPGPERERGALAGPSRAPEAPAAARPRFRRLPERPLRRTGGRARAEGPGRAERAEFGGTEAGLKGRL